MPQNILEDFVKIRDQLRDKPYLVACLCAEWCDTCVSYRPNFDKLAQQHPNKCFTWIDIEDHANLVEDLDIENFPSILVQHGDTVLFLGTVLPDISILHRLLSSLEESIEGAGVAAISPNIQIQTNHPLPKDWSLRQILLKS
ncbi:MAG: thioredoxin family protein [Undibacterium sp.]|nr:thioredoxin family protein [Undibacterium sp.]